MRGVVFVGLMACMPQPVVVPRVIPAPPAREAPAMPPPPAVRVETAPPPGGPQLPRDFVPVGYRARLVVGTNIEGHIEITGDVATPASKIWLHARIERGWSSPTANERDEVLARIDRLPLDRELTLAAKLIDVGDDRLFAKAVRVFHDFAPLVPDEQRARFDAWIEAKLGARARSSGFELDEPDMATKLNILDLAIWAKDRVILAQAAKITAGKIESWRPYPAIAAAASHDRAIALRVIDEATRVRTFDTVLARIDGIVDLLAADPTKAERIPVDTRMSIATHVCDAAHRDAALGLVKPTMVAALRTRIDDCIKRRDQLAPAFRAWLKTVKP